MRMSNRLVYTVKDLLYAARTRCRCGAGMAYPTKDTDMHGQWVCSRVLLGEVELLTKDDPQPAIPPQPANPGFSIAILDTAAQVHDVLPFWCYDVKSEGQPSAQGATTRPAGTHVEWQPHCTCKRCGHAWVAPSRRPSAPDAERLGGMDCPKCGARYVRDGFVIKGDVDACFSNLVVEDLRIS
jgi:hypothetical protein